MSLTLALRDLGEAWEIERNFFTSLGTSEIDFVIEGKELNLKVVKDL